jgi:hypothetical protein
VQSTRLIAPRPDDSVSAELASPLYVSHGRQRDHATKLDLSGASNLVRTRNERSEAARLEIPASSACLPRLSENYRVSNHKTWAAFTLNVIM